MKQFPIVAIGSSAGGIEAFTEFFEAMPPNENIAFVILGHLDPEHHSFLPQIIQKHTKMKVKEIVDGTKVKANNVYVIPPEKNLVIKRGTLFLVPLLRVRGQNVIIDRFFYSLAKDQGTNAICIVLSGNGSDGSSALENIKNELGMTIAQSEESTVFSSMPKSAIATGLIDYILRPKNMPEQLLDFTSTSSQEAEQIFSDQEFDCEVMEKIYKLLYEQKQNDFALYKKNTIFRRIKRRMHIHQINNLSKYFNFLNNNQKEIDTLFCELLIGVTKFFRDFDAYELITHKHIPSLVSEKDAGQTIRVWVAGCSTGEEAYSLAIILDECIKRSNKNLHFQIFATDIDPIAIETARNGVYPDSIKSNLSDERIKTYFKIEEGNRYIISKHLRDKVIFAKQNLTNDPPFSKIDLISCRNVLIYIELGMQRKLLSIFQHCLNPKGILFLGSSESIGGLDKYFTSNGKFNIFQKKDKLIPIIDVLKPTSSDSNSKAFGNAHKQEKIEKTQGNDLMLSKVILKEYSEFPCVIIDDNLDIIYIHGKVGKYLELAEGRVQINLIEMARPAMRSKLASSIKEAMKSRKEVNIENIKLTYGDRLISISVQIKPIFDSSSSCYLTLVSFRENKTAAAESSKNNGTSKKEIVKELVSVNEAFKLSIENLGKANDKLKMDLRDLQSTNEEMQIRNEELETTKEELQSLNEESITVNSELQVRIKELSDSNDDMKNLLDSSNTMTLFLYSNLSIRRFSPNTVSLIPLQEGDIGRPIKHFNTNIINIDLETCASKVLQDLKTIKNEVQISTGEYYIMTVRPYRTLNNVVDGVVITFDKIVLESDHMKILLGKEIKYNAIIELSSESIMIFDISNMKIIECCQKTYKRLEHTESEILELTILDIEGCIPEESIKVHIPDIKKDGHKEFNTKHKSKNGNVFQVNTRAKILEAIDSNLCICVSTYI